MTPEQFARLLQVARDLLAHRAAGHRCDRLAVEWAEQLLRMNPRHEGAEQK